MACLKVHRPRKASGSRSRHRAGGWSFGDASGCAATYRPSKSLMCGMTVNRTPRSVRRVRSAVTRREIRVNGMCVTTRGGRCSSRSGVGLNMPQGDRGRWRARGHLVYVIRQRAWVRVIVKQQRHDVEVSFAGRMCQRRPTANVRLVDVWGPCQNRFGYFEVTIQLGMRVAHEPLHEATIRSSFGGRRHFGSCGPTR